jgi:hypothetical protein
MAACSSTLTPPRHHIAILMASSGRFLVCRECHLSLEFPSGAALRHTCEEVRISFVQYPNPLYDDAPRVACFK